MHYVIIPGINGSGHEHWQTLWQDKWGSSASPISPASWDSPDLADWCHALDQATRQCQPKEVVLVAHSLGCLAAASWLRQRRSGVRGAFLVAAPDPSGPNFPATAAPSFTAIKAAPLTVPVLVVGSNDDPYCAPDAAGKLAAQWNAVHISIGRAGHINDASGLGVWESGQALLSAFTAGLGYPG
jgi:hypothetical protein